jgi:uncharacterized protein DUF2336
MTMTPRQDPPPRTAPTMGDEPRSAAVLDGVTQGYVLLDEAIIELADADSVRGIAKLIGQRLGLHPQAAVRALEAQSEEPVTVLCRAAGLNINVFSAVLRMRRRRCSSECSPSEALNAFLRIPIETAQRIVRMMPTRESGSCA